MTERYARPGPQREAMVVETGQTRRIVAGNRLIEIGQFVVIGVVKDGRLFQIEPVVWFAARIVAQLAST